MELGTEKEKKLLVWNMAKARGAARVRLLAVGVFLSVLAVTSKTLIDGMKRIWNIRGHLDTNQYRDRRFVVEFSEEGDFYHVVKGGPWSFRGDAVLVEELKQGEDPELFKFSTIPIWAQFKKIPFYLLSKKLATDLGKELGSFIKIDNDARGDICDKILRARVRIPVDQVLQRWITIWDGIAKEDVIVSIAYERLPNFCRFCGIIGHLATESRLPENEKKKRYEDDLEAAPTHPEDKRRWFLPDDVGQARPLPWSTDRVLLPRQVKPYPQRELAIVAHVANEVGKLSMHDHPVFSNKGEVVATSPRAPPPPPSTTMRHQDN